MSLGMELQSVAEKELESLMSESSWGFSVGIADSVLGLGCWENTVGLLLAQCSHENCQQTGISWCISLRCRMEMKCTGHRFS